MIALVIAVLLAACGLPGRGGKCRVQHAQGDAATPTRGCELRR